MSWRKEAGPRCLSCGMPIPRQTTTVFAPGPPGQPIAGWKYDGPGEVINKRFAHVTLPNGEREQRLWCVFIWNRESYETKSGFFCTMRCAADFAMEAARAGWRPSGTRVRREKIDVEVADC
jgi:hypothetical protein